MSMWEAKDALRECMKPCTAMSRTHCFRYVKMAKPSSGLNGSIGSVCKK
ncbi:mCG148383 [Mus musculus]|nr:mCG148383 [Mus musculus]